MMLVLSRNHTFNTDKIIRLEWGYFPFPEKNPDGTINGQMGYYEGVKVVIDAMAYLSPSNPDDAFIVVETEAVYFKADSTEAKVLRRWEKDQADHSYYSDVVTQEKPTQTIMNLGSVDWQPMRKP